MNLIPFSLLYAVCLALCFGGVEVLRISWDLGVPAVAPPMERAAIAVPPRPEGVRPVIGEGDEAYRYTQAACSKLEGQFQQICFHQLARQRAPTDLQGARDACATLPEGRRRHECTADVAELHARTDFAAARSVCPEIPRKKWRDQCVFGIALALSATRAEFAFRLCDEAGMWRDFCRHDVNGEIAVVDVDLALAHCAAEQGDQLTKKSCWHGVGKYIARVDVTRAQAACARTPGGLYRENCAHGLGWGAAESAGLAFAERCDQLGDVADSCRLGVAYNHRRFDQDGAMLVCAQVARGDLRDQCERFVRTGRL